MPLPYWPEPLLPNYKAGKYGPWTLSRTQTLYKVPGYFTPTAEQPPGWVLKKNRTVWMSLTRMEVESQMMHIAAARGHVVIAGLGMGFALYNIMRKPEVTRVTVLEISNQIIKLMDKTTTWRQWPGFNKVQIIEGDAREYKTNEPVDFLFADIWEHLGSYDALPVTQTIQSNVQAKEVGFWGQEYDLVSWCMQHNINSTKVNRRHYRAFCKDVNLPLIEQDDLRYPRLALLSVTLQTAAYERDPEAKALLGIQAYALTQEDDPFTIR